MTHEVAMVFDKQGRPLYWLNGRSAAVEDSRSLWEVVWENRENLGGVAHTHPWDGPTGPSGTDISTFAAIESGLGKRLLWPIVTMTHVHCFRHVQTATVGESDYVPVAVTDEWLKQWKDNLEKLRQLSRD